jgi:PKD repeat protein
MKSFLFTFVGIVLFFSANAQNKFTKAHPSTPSKAIKIENALQQKLAEFKPYIAENLFVVNTGYDSNGALRNQVNGSVFVEINPSVREQLISSKHEVLTLTVPFGDKGPLIIDLFKNSPFTEDLIIRTSDGQSFTVGDHVHYQGVVRNLEGSMAGVSITKNEIIGVINTNEFGSITIGKMENDDAVHVIYESDELPAEVPFECYTKNEEYEAETEELGHRGSKSPGDCVRIYVELDHTLYLNRGANIANCEAWVAGVFNNVGIIYTNEQIPITVSEIFIWTTPDSYSTSNAGTALSQFRNLRNSTGINGNLGHLCARGGSGLGGIAYLNSMCTNNRYAYSNINAGFQNFPAYSWTIMVVSHEMGHNLGSNHTQWCGWPGGAIDNCYDTEGDCPPGPQPVGGGTIMSYCHLNSTGINFLQGFGPLPGDRVRQRVNQVTCLDPCDDPNPCAGFIANLIVENTTCGEANGSLEVNISGGTAPYYVDFGQGQSPNTTSTGLPPGTYVINITDDNACTLSFVTDISSSNPVEFEIEHTIQVCEGGVGIAELNATNGLAPFTYDIGFGPQSTGNFSDLLPGLYTAVVTDAIGCQAAQEFIIDEQVPIAIGYDLENTSCGQENGAIYFSIFGGAAPFQIDIGQGFSSNLVYLNLSSGLYDVNLIDANGCTSSTSFEIAASQAIAVTSTVNHTTCGLQNGSIAIQATGGSGPLTYSINSQNQTTGVFSNLGAGTYNVSVSDGAGCLFTNTIAVQGSTLLAATVQSSNGCNPGGGVIIVTVSSGNPGYTYNFGSGPVSSNSQIGLNSGNYTVVVNDAMGCSVQLNATINNPQPIVVNAITTPANCAEENGSIQINASGGLAPYTYNLGNGAQSSNTFSNLSAGNYQVLVTDAGGCSNTQAIQVNSESALIANASVTPTTCGSTNGSVVIQVNGGQGPFVFQLGAIIQNENSFTNLPAGQYNAIVTDASGCSFAVGFQIAGSQAIVLEPEIVATTCGLQNGHAQIAVQGGAQPFSYMLNGVPQTSSNFSNLTSGNYELLITDGAGCVVEYDFEIGSSTAVSAGIIQVKSTCEEENGSLTVIAAGGNGNYQYTLNGVQSSQNVFENLVSGTYNLVITDAQGCNYSTQVNIENIGFIPSAEFSEKQHGRRIRFNNKSQHGASTLWTFGDGNTSTENNPSHLYDTEGEFEVCLITSNECGIDTLCRTLEVFGFAPCVEFDSLYLVDVFTITSGDLWEQKWDLESPYDLWEGLSFNKYGCLEKIELPNNNLTGEIPEIIKEFSSLIKMDLSGNQLSGNIPEELGDAVSLENLNLGNNQLTGSIPGTLSKLQNLKSIYLNDNKLEGSVPAFFDPMKLNVFWIHNNNFDVLPQLTHIGQLNDSIANFRFENNRFSFEDILPNITLFNNNDDEVIYAPQQPFYKDTTAVVAPGSDLSLSIDIDPDVTSNIYNWEKDGIEWNQVPSAILEISSANLNDEGVYQLIVTNPAVPKLTLESRLITVVVGSTGTLEIEGFSLNIYPNPVPASQSVILKWNSNSTFKGELSWIGINGQILGSEKISTISTQDLIQISAPSTPGLYILQLRSESGLQNHYKIAVY